ncbi:MAG TPA: hypothetical protein VKA74_12055, partial [Myxococcota bacterium]|nr:hypothetical protein [Myxococcota bacterium]
MAGTAAEHDTDARETEAVERDPSTLSQSEIDELAWNRLQAGNDPRSIRDEWTGRQDGQERAGDGDVVDDETQAGADDAGEQEEEG